MMNTHALPPLPLLASHTLAVLHTVFPGGWFLICEVVKTGRQVLPAEGLVFTHPREQTNPKVTSKLLRLLSNSPKRSRSSADGSCVMNRLLLSCCSDLPAAVAV